MLGISCERNHTRCGLLGLGISLIKFSRFVHVSVPHSFFPAGEYSTVWLDHIFFVHSSDNGHLGGFQFLAVVNSAGMNICVQVFVGTPVFLSFGCTPGRGHGHMETPHLTS